MYGDLIFAAPCDQTIKAMAKTTDTPIYHYLYTHIGKRKPPPYTPYSIHLPLPLHSHW